MNNEADCYGGMFPPLIPLTHNKTVAGKVFGYRVEHPGIVVTKREVTTNREAWRQCLQCSDFDSCYRLSTGTALMEMALKE